MAPLVEAVKVCFARRRVKLRAAGLAQLKRVFRAQRRPKSAAKAPEFDASPEFKESRSKKRGNSRRLSLSNPVFTNFLGKVEAHVKCLVEQIFRQYERIFENKFKPIFRGKAKVFFKYFNDLERQIGFNISSALKNQPLLRQLLTPHEFFKGERSIVGGVSGANRKTLLSQNFSTVLSTVQPETSNLLLDFTKSHIDNLNKGLDFEELGRRERASGRVVGWVGLEGLRAEADRV